MKTIQSVLRALTIVLLMGFIFTSPMATSAEFIPENSLPARLVIGQPDFTHAGAATTQTGMRYPNSIAVDPISHKVFVTDWANHRVLRFASTSALSNGAPAEAVLGQADFTTGSQNRAGAVAANTLSGPFGVFVDTGGRLWVADTMNSRILRFDDAANKTNGAEADGVLGQPDFTHNQFATTPNSMFHPYSVFVTEQDQLWVADTSNHRVLRFDDAASKPDGAGADGILGQSDFTTGTTGLSQAKMYAPTSVYVDPSDRLWVADHINNRVLRFDTVASKPNGADADGVLGQPDFNSQIPNCAQSGMNLPAGVSGDKSGRIYVSLWGQSRVLIFENTAGLGNGVNASYVLGQTDFTTCSGNTGGIGPATLNRPEQLFYEKDADRLWVTDRYNNRVLMYSSSSSIRCYVKADARGGNSGVDWTNAYTDLQSALKNWDCKEIWVAEGTYKPTHDADPTVSFNLRNGVVLYGGFAGTELSLSQRDWASHPTRLSGEIGDFNSNIDNSFHVITGTIVSTMAVVDGFIVEGGYADSTIPDQWGGGMYIHNNILTLRNMVFRDNFAYGGGGLFVRGGRATLINVVFTNNTASINGGALHTYEKGQAGLYNVTISGNHSEGNGGGIILYSSEDEILMGNTILWGNTAPEHPNLDWGNGVVLRASYSLVEGECPSWANCSNMLPGNSDPKFVDLASGNLRLQADSPAIDAGAIGWVPADTHDIDGDGIVAEHIPYDLDAEPRMVHNIVDLGAFEFGAELFLPAILR